MEGRQEQGQRITERQDPSHALASGERRAIYIQKGYSMIYIFCDSLEESLRRENEDEARMQTIIYYHKLHLSQEGRYWG